MDSIVAIIAWFMLFALVLPILIFFVPGFIAGWRYTKTPEYKAARKRSREFRPPVELRPPHGCQDFELSIGKQVMSPKVYLAGDFFRIDINKTITIRGGWDSKGALIDAHVYGSADASPSAWKPHNCLYVDDISTPAVPFESQGHLHRHSFIYLGTGERLSLFLEMPKRATGHLGFTGALSVSTTPLSVEEANQIRKRAPIEALGAYSGPECSPEDEAEKAVAVQQLEFAQQLYTLSHTYGNDAYQDDTWVEAYGKKYHDDLLNRKKAIIAAYLDFHSDQAFIEYLKDKSPDVYRRVTWEHRALATAERYIVESTERRRPAPTPEQFRERMMRRLQVQAQDHIRRAVEVETAVQRYRHTLEELELDEEEIEEKLQHFRDILTDEGDDNGTFASV